MKKRRRLLVLGLLATALLVTGWMASVLRQRSAPPPHRINPESFEQIRADMTMAEVEAIVGVPPGNYASVDVAIASGPDDHIISLRGDPHPLREEEIPLEGFTAALWTSNWWTLYVGFDKGQVWAKCFCKMEPAKLTFWGRIKAKCGF